MFTSLLVSFHAGPSAGWRQVAVCPTITVSVPVGATPLTYEGPIVAGEKAWSFGSGKATYIVSMRKVSSKDLAENSPDVLLGKTVFDSVNYLVSGDIKEQKDTVFNGWPGIESLVVRNFMSARKTCSYLVRDTMFTLTETYSVSAGQPADSDNFLNSLVILPTPGPGPQKEPGPGYTALRCDDGGFSIRMPATPRSDDPEPKIGHPLPARMYQSQYGDRFFMVGYMDVPPNAPAAPELRTSSIKQIVQGYSLTWPRGAKTLHDGVEFSTAEFKKDYAFVGRVAVAVTNSRIYVITAIYPSIYAGSKEINDYFDSFKFLPAAKVGSAKTHPPLS